MFIQISFPLVKGITSFILPLQSSGGQMHLRAQGQAPHALSNMDQRVLQSLLANHPQLKGVNLMEMLDGLMTKQKGLVQQQQQQQQRQQQQQSGRIAPQVGSG